MKYLTVKIAAQQLGISTKRVSKLCNEGTIKAERAGARVYIIDPDSLAQYKHSESRKHTPHTFSGGRPPATKKK